MAAAFGELLGRFVPLSSQDVLEILEDQAVSHRRFGQIALCLGLCRPDHVWRAWGVQLAQQPGHCDLQAVGIDAQAVSQVEGTLARAFEIVPIRALPDQLILAVSKTNLSRAAEQIPGLLDRQTQFVLAEAWQIAEAIERYYPLNAARRTNVAM